MHLVTRNVNTAFKTLVSLFSNGYARGEHQVDIVRRSSRNGPVMMIDEPVTITYSHPRERVLFNTARDANPFSLLYEALWMLAGRNDVASLAHYTKRFTDYSDNGTTLNGAYGHRWRRGEVRAYNEDHEYLCVDQLDVLVQHLKSDPNSRRAVLQMWNTEQDLLHIGGVVDERFENTEKSRDVCCNLSVLFSIRDNKLDMTVFNRSNDLIWGCLGANYVHFTILQEYMATRIGVEVGVYHHVSNNLHVYESNWKPDEWLTDKTLDDYQVGRPTKTMPLVRDPVAFERELPLFVETYSGDDPNRQTFVDYGEPFLRDVAQPMMQAFYQYKIKNWGQAISECGLIVADDWRIAAQGWIQRRINKRSR